MNELRHILHSHIDQIKGYTVAGYNLAAVAFSAATTIAWLQIVSLIIGIILGVLTIKEKLRGARKRNRDRDEGGAL